MTEPKVTVKSKGGSNKKTITSPVKGKSAKPSLGKKNASPYVAKEKEVHWNSMVPSDEPFQKKGKIQWSKFTPFIVSIVGAIIIGSILGFSILSLFSGSSGRSQNSIDSHLPAVHSDATKKENPNILPLHAYVMQAGNYSSAKKAANISKKFRIQGLSAVVSGKKPFRVLIGVATDQQQGRKLAETYQKKGINVYVKEWNFESRRPALSADAITLINAGHQLFRSLSEKSTKNLQSKKKKKVEFSDEMKQYQDLTSQYKKMSNRLKPQEKTAILEMIRSLDLSVQSSTEVEKHMSDALLLQMQEGLVRYIMAYKKLVELTS